MLIIKKSEGQAFVQSARVAADEELTRRQGVGEHLINLGARHGCGVRNVSSYGCDRKSLVHVATSETVGREENEAKREGGVGGEASSSQAGQGTIQDSTAGDRSYAWMQCAQVVGE